MEQAQVSGLASRTHDEIFNGWKASDQARTRWSEWWAQRCRAEIQAMRELGFHLFPLPHHSKRPYPGMDWSKGVHSEDSLVANLVNGRGNMAVIAGRSKPPLVVLDWDSDELPPTGAGWPLLTLTQRTVRGWQFFTKEPFGEKAWKKLRTKYPGFDTPRTGVMYALVPLSITCRNDLKGGCDRGCRHDWRVREWVPGSPRKVVRFSEFAQALV